MSKELDNEMDKAILVKNGAYKISGFHFSKKNKKDYWYVCPTQTCSSYVRIHLGIAREGTVTCKECNIAMNKYTNGGDA